jgi:SAM-dependent methyltransferase
MSAQSHRSDPRVLARRTLSQDHRCLAELLRPGSSVLDVGCGTGSISAGIATAVGKFGRVVGIDRDPGLLAIARDKYARVKNLQFELGDAMTISQTAEYDFVTSARTLQWISDPSLAIQNMARALKPSGILVVLDYNHVSNRWEAEPPKEFEIFYDAFLAWRSSNGWDNQIADHLPALFESAGLLDVRTEAQDEVTERGSPDFTQRAALWSEVIDRVGEQLSAAGFCTKAQVEDARTSYATWAGKVMISQTLALKAVVGVAP